MKKIRGEFLTETEANSAMEKINPHCLNARIIYDYYGYNDYYSYGSLTGSDALEGFRNFYSPGMPGFFAFSGLGYNPSRPLMPTGLSGISGRAALEADVEDNNFEYVKDILYSLGAISVM